jgi:hypothetical protein
MLSNATSGSEFRNFFEQINNIPVSIKRLFSFHGIYEIISIFGMWGLLFIFLLNKNIRILLKQKTTLYMVLFLFIVLIHALLSTEIARMFYIATPVIAVWLSLISDEIIIIKS